ncbi:MAG: hypothetical protein C5B50_16275 [Verrucomicrobia bacterium]|nr:MAG: hypothetical protein C5B50_16275 [Verrucomicrobiota bacterium]
MTVLFRCRVEPKLLNKARKVSANLGTSLEETVRMFMSQIARTGRVPLSLEVEDGLVDIKRRNDIWSKLDDSTAEDW